MNQMLNQSLNQSEPYTQNQSESYTKNQSTMFHWKPIPTSLFQLVFRDMKGRSISVLIGIFIVNNMVFVY